MNGSRTNEFSEVNSNIRHYSNLRFAILTVFVAANAAIISLYTVNQSTEWIDAKLIHNPWILGIFASFVFGYLECGVNTYIHKFQERATELEKELGYSGWQQILPKERRLRSNFAVLGIYIIILIGWLILMGASFLDGTVSPG